MIRRLLPAVVMLAAVPTAGHAACLGLCTCTVVATGVTFSNYNPITGGDVSNNGNVAVTCRVLNVLNLGLFVSYQISLSAGASGSAAQRKMFKGGDALNYNLFTNNGYGTVWSTGGSAVSDTYLLLLTNTTRNYAIYGRIPSGQNTVPVGTYNDPTITVTVTY